MGGKVALANLKKNPIIYETFDFILSMFYRAKLCADSYAQKTLISIDVHNQRVEDILKEIEEQSDFDFFFNNKHVDLNRRVSISADKSNIFSVLKEIFAGTNVRYSVLDKKIILSVEAQSPQQEKKMIVSGTISDVQGEPVIGASVLEKEYRVTVRLQILTGTSKSPSLHRRHSSISPISAISLKLLPCNPEKI